MSEVMATTQRVFFIEVYTLELEDGLSRLFLTPN
jgi:hypothetical protein